MNQTIFVIGKLFGIHVFTYHRHKDGESFIYTKRVEIEWKIKYNPNQWIKWSMFSLIYPLKCLQYHSHQPNWNQIQETRSSTENIVASDYFCIRILSICLAVVCMCVCVWMLKARDKQHTQKTPIECNDIQNPRSENLMAKYGRWLSL